MSGISGTQSPPLEATGEHRPMGVSSVEQATQMVKDDNSAQSSTAPGVGVKDKGVGGYAVPDEEQRGGK